MSVQAPTTYNRVGSPLPEELGDECMDYLDGATLKAVTECSAGSKKRVHEHYLRGYEQDSQLIDAYQASQEESKEPLNLKRRAVSLLGKTERLFGGPRAVELATDESSKYHPQTQGRLARGRWNCKAVGLVPFLKAIPAAIECLEQIAQMASDRDKYKQMKAWIEAHPDKVARLRKVEAAGLKAHNIEPIVRPTFYDLGGKIYNFIPKEIRHFTGLQALHLNNNRLSELPAELAQLPFLRTLHLSSNFLTKFPPPIPSLNKLFLDGNKFSYREVSQFIKNYLEVGGEYIEIQLDREHAENPKYQELIEEMPPETTLKIEVRNGLAVFIVEKKLEATQPL